MADWSVYYDKLQSWRVLQVAVGRSAGFDPARYDLSDAENGETAPLAAQEGPGSPSYQSSADQECPPLGGHLLVCSANNHFTPAIKTGAP